jgi:hypothetical protein
MDGKRSYSALLCISSYADVFWLLRKLITHAEIWAPWIFLS